MKTPQMNLIVWIKDAKSFHFKKQVVKYTNAALKNIAPKPLNPLVVDTFSYIKKQISFSKS